MVNFPGDMLKTGVGHWLSTAGLLPGIADLTAQFFQQFKAGNANLRVELVDIAGYKKTYFQGFVGLNVYLKSIRIIILLTAKCTKPTKLFFQTDEGLFANPMLGQIVDVFTAELFHHLPKLSFQNRNGVISAFFAKGRHAVHKGAT